jgi:hypothetical protein
MWYGERGGGETMVVSVVWHCSSQTGKKKALQILGAGSDCAVCGWLSRGAHLAGDAQRG